MKKEKNIKSQSKNDKSISKIKELEEKILDLENGWRRTQADFENFRNRTQKEKAELIKYSNKDLIVEILPVIDNFSRALKHKPKDLQDNDYLKGLEYTKIQLEQILKQNGLTRINIEIGSQFDLNIEEAIETIENDKLKTGQVAEIVLDGYRLGDKLIRPAQVKVVK